MCKIFKFVLVLVISVVWQEAARAELPGVGRARCVEVISRDQNGHGINYPSSLYYDSGADEVYVNNPGQRQMVIYTADYFPHLSIGAGRGALSPTSAFTSNRTLYLCEGVTAEDPKGHLAVFDAALMPVKKIYFSGFEGAEDFVPHKMVVGKNGRLYVTGNNSSRVVVLDSSGSYLHSLEPVDDVLGVSQKASVSSLAVGEDGRLYLLSEELGRIFVYSADEKFLYKFGQKGGIAGKLSRPRGVAVDDANRRIYVVDYMRHAVSVYGMDGHYLFEFGGKGLGRGWFVYPSDVCVDGRGRVLVADTFNHRVQVFEVTTP